MNTTLSPHQQEVIFEYLGIALTNRNKIIMYRIFHQKNIGMMALVRCLPLCVCVCVLLTEGYCMGVYVHIILFYELLNHA
jgi:hypothetical protein